MSTLRVNTARVIAESFIVLTTVLTTIVVINNGIVGLTDAKIGGFTYQKGLFLMILARNDGIVVVRLPPSPPNPVTQVIGFFVCLRCFEISEDVSIKIRGFIPVFRYSNCFSDNALSIMKLGMENMVLKGEWVVQFFYGKI